METCSVESIPAKRLKNQVDDLENENIRLKLFNIPKYLSPKDLKKEICSFLKRNIVTDLPESSSKQQISGTDQVEKKGTESLVCGESESDQTNSEGILINSEDSKVHEKSFAESEIELSKRSLTSSKSLTIQITPLQIESCDIKVKKGPKWSFAFVSFSDATVGEFLLQKIQHQLFQLKKLIVRAEISVEADLAKQPTITNSNSSPSSLLQQVAPLHHLSYDEQLNTKLADIKQALPTEIATQLSVILPSPAIDGYRNKSEFSIGFNSEDEPTVGFTMGLFKDGIIAVESAQECPHIASSHKAIAEYFNIFLRSSSYAPFNRADKTGYWRILIVRSNSKGEHMVALQMHPQSLSQQEIDSVKEELRSLFTATLSNVPLIASVQLQLCSSLNHGMSQKDPFQIIFGTDHIFEYLFEDSLKFRISINSFFQVNTPATEVLYGKIAEWVRSSTPETTSGYTLLDLCCGTGTIGIALARHVDRVIGVEMVPEAIKDAQFNADMNGITNIEFICNKLENCIDEVIKKIDPNHAIVIVLDPPRSGTHPSVIACLKRRAVAERVSRIVYVSCNAVLAKSNFESLMRETVSEQKAYYSIENALQVDLFPHTKHSELLLAFKPVKN